MALVLAGVDHEHVDGAHVNFLVTPPSDDPAELEGLSEADQVRRFMGVVDAMHQHERRRTARTIEIVEPVAR